ncbi:TetR/AcrR family transcriptional regulator [Actinoplanes sp. NPDC049265]|uniref:TetR/AcrR family transcriptional regulator n=1 Tax=Actinoplanes sp. NPDC049265 TaxID=3363902 RepID=UPI003717C721
MAAVTGRLRADAERNRAQIVAAARVVFIEAGSAAPLEEIARRAGVGIGTLYRRFPDRSSLIRAVAMENVSALEAEARAALTAEGTAWESLARLMRRSIDLGFSTLLTMLTDDLQRELTGDARFRELRAGFIVAMEALVTRAQQEGSLRPDVGTGDVFVLVTLLLRKAPGGSADMNDLLMRRCVALMLDSLRAGPHDTLPGRPVHADDLSA